MAIPHSIHHTTTTRGLTLPLPSGPRTVLSTHPRFSELVAAAAHPASTGAFLTRLVDGPEQLAEVTR